MGSDPLSHWVPEPVLEADPDMRWLWKTKKKNRKLSPAPDPAISQARAQVQMSFAAATRQRDIERRKLREERRTVVQPLQESASANHFSELIRLTIRHPRENR